MKKKTKKNLSCALLVGMSLLLTGCTDSQNAAMSYRIDAPAGKLETAAGESYAENYLSDSLCVQNLWGAAKAVLRCNLTVI